MNLKHFENPDMVAQAICDELQNWYHELSRPLKLFLPTGQTPKPLYQRFRADPKQWSQQLTPIQIDEFLDGQRLFYRELLSEVLDPLGLKDRSYTINSDKSRDEMEAQMKAVLNIGVDGAILGMGPNGHVGFHEPGVPAEFLGGMTQVTDEDRMRVAGAKTNEVMTFGVGAFKQCKKIFLIVTGKSKTEIFKKFLSNPPSEKIPATLLKGHREFFVYTDIKI